MSCKCLPHQNSRCDCACVLVAAVVQIIPAAPCNQRMSSQQNEVEQALLRSATLTSRSCTMSCQLLTHMLMLTAIKQQWQLCSCGCMAARMSDWA